MTRTLKTWSTLGALTLTLAPLALAARPVQAPLAGTVSATTYSSSGAYHGAVDLQGGSCGQTPVSTGAAGSLIWKLTIPSEATGCGGSLAAQNEALHDFGGGWSFRLRGFLRPAGSAHKTCDRCDIGKAYRFYGNANVEQALHLQYDKMGTRDAQWYAGTTMRGALSDGEYVGSLDH